MSAIAGFFNLDETPASQGELERMLRRMAAFRTVDTEGKWCAGTAALGHLLECHTPEDSFEQQPSTAQSERFIFTGDIRLDNREELAHSLGFSSNELKQTPDSALVFAAWHKWGSKCPQHLLGDFAFAVWDNRDQTLFCARDHMGVRPLYYFCSIIEQQFAFASAIKGLRAITGATERLDETALGDFLLVFQEDKERTFYQNIKRLPPAHTLTIDARGRITLNQYWAPDPEFELKLSSNDEYIEGLREQLSRAVNSRMRSIHPTSVMLSGGLDSSSIACLAARKAASKGGRITALSSVLPTDFKGPEQDEWEYVQILSNHQSNIDCHRVIAPDTNFLTGLDNIFAVYDQPSRDTYHYMHTALLESASKLGTRNLLWGFGGDHCVSSQANNYLADFARDGDFWRLISEIGKMQKTSPRSFPSLVVRQIVAPLLPESLHWKLRRNGAKRLAKSALKREFARKTGALHRLSSYNTSHQITSGTLVRNQAIKEITSGNVATALEYMAQLSSFFGIRLNMPLLDKQLIEYSLALPNSLKAGDGWKRLAIRHAMDGILPPEIQWRLDKGPFSPDFDRRVSADEAEIHKLIDVLSTNSRVNSYVDFEKIRRTMHKRRKIQSGTDWNLDTLTIVAIGLFAAKFIYDEKYVE